jgi:hypothetical protein
MDDTVETGAGYWAMLEPVRSPNVPSVMLTKLGHRKPGDQRTEKTVKCAHLHHVRVLELAATAQPWLDHACAATSKKRHSAT